LLHALLFFIYVVKATHPIQMINRQQLDQRRKAARIERRQDLTLKPRHPGNFAVEPAREAKGSYFFRLVISPDPRGEDSDKNLALRALTEKTIANLEDRFQHPLPWVAAVHADHADHRHVHVIAIVPERLQVQDFQRMRSAATQEALEQLRQLDLAHEQRELSQQQREGLGLSW